MLGNLMGGGQPPPQQLQDFANRYGQGAPENISDQEAAQAYQQVAQQLPPEQYQQAAQTAFAQLSPDQRAQFAQMLQQQAQQQGVNLPQVPMEAYQDPNALAQMTTQVHQQQPGLLGGLFGGGQSGPTWATLDPQTKDLFTRTWGDKAQEKWEQENSQAHSPFNSPVAKIALAGVAAIAIKTMLGK